MREVVAGAGGCVAGHAGSLAAVCTPAALQAVCLVLPEGTLCHISCSVNRLQGTEKSQSGRYELRWDAFLLVLVLQRFIRLL